MSKPTKYYGTVTLTGLRIGGRAPSTVGEEIKEALGLCFYTGCKETQSEDSCYCEEHLRMMDEIFWHVYKKEMEKIKYDLQKALLDNGKA